MALQQRTQPFQVDAAIVNSDVDVFSRDGAQLDFVRGVWAHIPEYGYVAKSRFTLADYDPVRGTTNLVDGAEGYIEIAPRRGIRREGEQELCVPLEAIHDAVRGQALTVAASRDTCYAHFAHRPACSSRSQ